MPFEGPTLHVDLEAIRRNWRKLAEEVHPAACAAVVKADAYGLGVAQVAPALFREGCQDFFVATTEEGVQLRNLLPKARVFVFHGPAAGEESHYLQHALIPVLNDPGQMERWRKVSEGSRTIAALHVDTGMCRLGLSPAEATVVLLDQQGLRTARVALVMSHLACASTPEHPLNREQLATMQSYSAMLPMDMPISLANSAGIYLGRDYHYSLARPGCALYGISPNTDLPNPMEEVATLTAPILQIREIDRVQTVGYGATRSVGVGARVATLQLGYADGFMRVLSNNISGYIGPHEVPVLGRVSMDMVCVDVTKVPFRLLEERPRVELLGPHQGVDEVAKLAGTIGYEVFTRLGQRVRRVYAPL